MSLPEIPAVPLKAAMDAAWPGLPDGMTLEEAERRTRAALTAAYPHLVDARDQRIGPLLQLAQGLMAKYNELAQIFANQITDDADRAQLIEHVQTVLGEARDAYAGLVLAPDAEVTGL